MDIKALKSTLDTGILTQTQGAKPEAKQGLSFVDAFKDAVAKVNATITEGDKAGLDLASGKNGNIHEAMLQMSKADTEMRLMVTTVNKMVDCYNELMRLR